MMKFKSNFLNDLNKITIRRYLEKHIKYGDSKEVREKLSEIGANDLFKNKKVSRLLIRELLKEMINNYMDNITESKTVN